MIPKLFSILKADSSVTTLLGTSPLRVYPWGEAPQKVAYPYVTYYVYNGNPENYINQVPDVDTLGTQVDVWAENGKSCLAVAEAVRDAIEPTSHMTSISNMTRDKETKSYRVRMDFDMITER